jgi:hypothetical protein
MVVENRYEVKIAERVLTDEKGYSHLVSVYNEIMSSEHSDVEVNFVPCTYFEANLGSVLGSLLDKALLQGKTIWVKPPSKPGVRRSLSRIGFLSAFDVLTSTQDRETFIPYTRFPLSESQRFKKYIEDYLIQKQQFPHHTKRAGNYILESIFEVFANALTHGNCSHVYCCGEYHPNKNPAVLDMTIVDCGQTIVGNVNKFIAKRGGEGKSPVEAIEWAFAEGHTTKDVPGGIGLWQLQEFIKLNSGSLQIVSDKGMVEFQKGTRHSIEMKQAFPGTIVNMAFNFNDDKIYHMSNEINMNDLL